MAEEARGACVEAEAVRERESIRVSWRDSTSILAGRKAGPGTWAGLGTEAQNLGKHQLQGGGQGWGLGSLMAQD